MSDSSASTETDPQPDADPEASSDTDADADSTPDRTVIRSGREFEQEYRLRASEAGQFLVDLGEQLRDDDELTIVDDEWELPFAFGEPVELELDYDGVGDAQLEIEIELPGRADEEAPDVE